MRDLCKIRNEERREIAQVDRVKDKTIFDDDEWMESIQRLS